MVTNFSLHHVHHVTNNSGSGDTLKKAIKKAWDEMPDEMVARVVDNWPDRLQACIDAEGGYIE